MIETLAKPSICVIDDEKEDFLPILAALNSLYLSAVHIIGNSAASLPEKPFEDLRLVFTDLYLSSSAVGKDMAAHTAKIFCGVVSPDTAPVVVVIWSKHAGDKFNDGTPPDDQPSEADLFKSTLLEAEPKYKGRLIFIEMAKIRKANPDEWIPELKEHISNLLKDCKSIEALWAWESLVKSCALKVSKDLTDFSVTDDPNDTLQKLKETLQLLTNAQKEGVSLTKDDAPQYLSVALGQLLIDHVEHSSEIQTLEKHGEWLIEPVTKIKELSPSINSMLLTAEAPNTKTPFLPGTVYLVDKEEELNKLLAIDLKKIKSSMQKLDVEKITKDKDKQAIKDWTEDAKFVLLEITPVCDVDNGERAITTLLLGLIQPERNSDISESKDSFKKTPVFSLRKGLAKDENRNVFLVFSSRYKVTLPANKVPEWILPFFRLRELPTSDIRNWHASQTSRVGYVCL